MCLPLLGVASFSRINKITGLFCRIWSFFRGSIRKSICNFIDPTHRCHPIIKNPPFLITRKGRHIIIAQEITVLIIYLHINSANVIMIYIPFVPLLSCARTLHVHALTLSHEKCQAFACWKFGMVPNSPMAPMGVGILGMFLIYRLQV